MSLEAIEPREGDEYRYNPPCHLIVFYLARWRLLSRSLFRDS